MSLIRELMGSAAYKKIEQDVSVFVEEKLSGYKPQRIESKTIHDSIWGSVDYSAWEMQIIDSPLFQRLRDLSQTGLAMFTYPTARHSRFEHSLGVATVAKKICARIPLNCDENIPGASKNCIILAALLHDIGHCFYSHLSETIYGELEDFRELRKQFSNKLELNPKPHEILSFIIINCAAFKEFFFYKVDYPEKSSSYVQNNLLLEAGQAIIGDKIKRNEKSYSYITAIINGPFDADKLDYIKRDSITAGLALEYDLERLFAKISIHETFENGIFEKRLMINYNGVTAIEELTFCKIMLFSYIYYHHKVLVSEAMIRDYIYGLCELGIINSFADFLKYTDSDILGLAQQQKDYNPFPSAGAFLDLKKLTFNIRNRVFPKRCFEMGHFNIEPLDFQHEKTAFKSKAAFEYFDRCKRIIDEIKSTDSYDLETFSQEIQLLSTMEERIDKPPPLNLQIKELQDLDYGGLLVKRKDFYDMLVAAYKEAGLAVSFNLFDIYLIFPKEVNYGTTVDAVVLCRDKVNTMTINDFIKLDDWAAAFNSNKWRGYVFVSDKIDRTIAYKVAEKFVLKGKAKLKNPTAYIKGLQL